MKLYLSSDLMGDHVDVLFNMIGAHGKVGVIQNACDAIPQENRNRWIQKNFDPVSRFQDEGFESEDLDLRTYFGRTDALEAKLHELALVFAIGGNSFLLRRAMRQSGFDRLIKPMLDAGQIVYGGWSAGVCVAGPSLKGVELMDPPDEIMDGYDPEPVWDGLALIDKLIIPHYRSPGHPETDAAERAVRHAVAQDIPHMAMRDGDVLVRDGNDIRCLKAVPK